MALIDWSLLHKGFVILIKPWLWLGRPLKESDFSSDPIVEFEKWYKKAKRCVWLEFPDSMCLSTIDEDGFPDGRMVLLKGFDERGFVFYTNFNSRKGRALRQNPKAGLTFYWEGLQRQIRILGEVEEVKPEEADAYFASRLRLSQIGAWASKQSEAIAGREVLEKRVEEYSQKFKGQKVPRPPHWSGFRVKPRRIEFWKLRFNRLHDRFEYLKKQDGSWDFTRLSP